MYKDHGCNQFDRRLTDKQKQRLVKRLTELGHPVGIKARLPPDPCCGTAAVEVLTGLIPQKRLILRTLALRTQRREARMLRAAVAHGELPSFNQIAA